MTGARRMLVVVATACAGAAVLASACGGVQLDGQQQAIAELIATARDNGAQRCAPVELAMAESHHDFAVQDMSEGNYYRARDQLAVAEDNAKQAIQKSPKARCAPGKPVRVATVTDRDGDGIADDVDKCPDDPEDFDGFQDEDGCPEPDNDGDGLADGIDQCPNDPEDIDGFQDEDGCPDPDNDGDGLADKIDSCPNEPEDIDGFEDEDGCPDCDDDGDGVPECPEPLDKCPGQKGQPPDGCPVYKNITVTEQKIELKQTIYFDYNKSTIKPVSFSLLNEVGQALKDHPKIEVRIEGHTDSRGRDAYNMQLSQARAEAVRDYLIAQGIDGSRMVARGYGETQPIADNRTQAGRDQNRRVEFVITAR